MNSQESWFHRHWNKKGRLRKPTNFVAKNQDISYGRSGPKCEASALTTEPTALVLAILAPIISFVKQDFDT
jgi:hypothetical protein